MKGLVLAMAFDRSKPFFSFALVVCSSALVAGCSASVSDMPPETEEKQFVGPVRQCTPEVQHHLTEGCDSCQISDVTRTCSDCNELDAICGGKRSPNSAPVDCKKLLESLPQDPSLWPPGAEQKYGEILAKGCWPSG